MESTEYPLTIEQGSTFQKQLRWKVDGVLMNLTGYTAKMQLRRRANAAVIFELSGSNSRILLGGTAGTISMEITAEDTATIPAGNYVYDLELTSSSTTGKLLRGTVVVSGEVTK